MKTTQEKIAVMQAYADGKRIECRNSITGTWDLWMASEEPTWGWSQYDYRIASEPKLRPWKPEEVPVGALFRNKAYRSVCLILGNGAASNCGVAMTTEEGFTRRGYEYLMREGEHSTDHGKTWKPCGVIE